LKKLADNDELGNPVAHFFKSGNVLRSKDNDKLVQLKSLMPEKWINDTKIEYDVWYDFPNDKRIHGYVYTDVLTQFLYLRVASSMWAIDAMKRAAVTEITEEGERFFKEITNNSGDKYRLRRKGLKHDFVIFLPGTNILDKVTDWGKVDSAVKQGAKLKCHPLTSAPAYEHLVHKYGDAVIDKKASGHELLDNASIVGCCDNSEMGIVALAKGKTVHRFGKQEQWCTYSAIYKALLHDGQLNADRLKAILSCKGSGLIPASIDYPQERINRFFLQYGQEEHVAPKNFSSRVQSVKRAYA
jgi:hypothetical protein